MSKNGFFHARPDDEDIWVDPEMVDTVGAKSVNWHVILPRQINGQLFAVVIWKGVAYTTQSYWRGADHYWKIVGIESDPMIVLNVENLASL